MFAKKNVLIYVIAAVCAGALETIIQFILNAPFINGFPFPAIPLYFFIATIAFLALITVYSFIFHRVKFLAKSENPALAGAVAAITLPFAIYLGTLLLPGPIYGKAIWAIFCIAISPALGYYGGWLLLHPYTRRAAGVIGIIVIVGVVVYKLLPLVSNDGKPNQPNVVLITLDTTRADHIPCYGYEKGNTPNLDRIAKEGYVAPRAACEVPVTAPSHASMLTGLSAHSHGVLLNGMFLAADVPTLPEMLADEGYETAAFLAASSLWARDTGLDRGFEVYDDAMTPLAAYRPTPLVSALTAKLLDKTIGFLRPDDRELERTADEVTDSALGWLKKKHNKPYFLWVHYFDPHDDYWPPAEFAPEGLEDREKQMEVNSAWLKSDGKKYDDEVNALYNAEITYMDYHVGRIYDELDKRGELENTIIVVVGDHGEGMFDHGVPFHGFRIYREDLGVPFIVFDGGAELPGIEGGENIATTLDVTPTVLHLLGTDIPDYIQGESIFGGDFAAREYTFATCFPEPLREVEYSEGRLDSIYNSREKLIVSSDKAPEFYLLIDDPGERYDLLAVSEKAAPEAPDETARNAERAEELETILLRYLEELPKADASERTIDEETMKALQDLGYL